MTPLLRCARWGRAAGRSSLDAGPDLLALLLPGRCPSCQGVSSGDVCQSCLGDCRPPPGPACVRCAAPWTLAGFREGWCGRCWRYRRPFAFEAALALWHYRGAPRRIVLAVKFSGRRDALRPLGRRMARCTRAASLRAVHRPDLVVPIPARSASRRQRGYDQAFGLAQGVAESLGSCCEASALRRRREPARAQARSSGEERRKQLRAGFRARTARVSGRSVLLVDDVLSTGATADAAARALKLAGASSVRVLVLAS